MLLSILDFENSKEYAGFAKYSVETTIKEGNVVLGGVVGGYNLALEEAGADLERKLHSKDGLFLPTPRCQPIDDGAVGRKSVTVFLKNELLKVLHS